MEARTAEARAIKNDQCENPGCFYSTMEDPPAAQWSIPVRLPNNSKDFSAVPGKPSVEIFRNEDKKDGNTTLEDRGNGEGGMMNPFFGFGDGNRTGEANRNGAVRGMMDDMLGNFFGHRRDGGDGKAPNVLGIASSTNFNACTANLTSFGSDLKYIISMVEIALIKRKDTGPHIDQMKIETPNKCQPQSRNCKRGLKSIVRKRQ